MDIVQSAGIPKLEGKKLLESSLVNYLGRFAETDSTAVDIQKR
ncbi:hypothetical protein OQJ68_05450 [Microbulbifer thermotolerans]|uniref:Uncharacterized protein n=1 Tax=Microbulbifer thermotolerans TaxID=252514 RepID=A0AB35HWU9_MICTH|nr:hypothetical protein [Microbulbifer thermotolerans]MCX2801232.1 hypothetical protein [Microbulbifer thermotolerans]